MPEYVIRFYAELLPGGIPDALREAFALFYHNWCRLGGGDIPPHTMLMLALVSDVLPPLTAGERDRVQAVEDDHATAPMADEKTESAPRRRGRPPRTMQQVPVIKEAV